MSMQYPAPDPGLQLDLMTAVARLRQIRDEPDMAESLLDRLVTCDLPRLEHYLTAETLAWADEALGESA